MSTDRTGEVERLEIAPTTRVARWSAVAWLAAVLATATMGWPALLGVALGGGLSLGLFSLHRLLVSTCVRPDRWRKRRVIFWLVWLLKWPAVGTLLYVVVRGGWVNPGWLCAGATLVPAVATALALRALAADGLARRPVWGSGR